MKWKDELLSVAVNTDPMPLDFALAYQHPNTRICVIVSPSEYLSEQRFKHIRVMLRDDYFSVVKKRYIKTTRGIEVMFLSKQEIEDGKLRGIGAVIWVG